MALIKSIFFPRNYLPANVAKLLAPVHFISSSYSMDVREAAIAQALDTPEGRIALTQAMVEPIRQALSYQAIGRRLLMVDELPQGALARYEADVSSVASAITRRE